MNSMKNQNKLIRKLLQIGKKHKVLVYPMLALVAVISVFSYLYRWATSSGKRVVAAILVGVLVISQSYFMTSSANESGFIIEEEEEEQLIDTSAVEDEPEQEDSLVDSSAVTVDETESDSESNDDETVGSSTAADLEDPEDYRDTDKDNTTAEQNDSDSESEGTIKKDTYSEEGGKGSIINMQLPSGTEQSRIYPAGTPDKTVQSYLPDVLLCTVRLQSGSVVGQELKVTWSAENFANYNGSTVYYVPTVTGASSYESITEDLTDVTITVEFLTKYTISFNYTGDLSAVDFPYDSSANTYYGFVGKTYTLPNVNRSRADGNGNFTFSGWYYDNTLQGGAGDSYLQSSEKITSVTLTARYGEAEVTYKDDRHDDYPKYDYPSKGSAYTVPASMTPADIYGYKFLGWLSDGNVVNAGETASDSVDDMTLTASWEALQYRITYDANYGTGSGIGNMNSEIHRYDASGDSLTSCGYMRYGYRFMGWATSAGASAAEFENGQQITNDMILPYFQSNLNQNMAEITLYAIWEEVAITYEDGTVSKNVDTTYGDAFSESFGVTNGESSSGNFGAVLKSASLNGNSCNVDDYIENFTVTPDGAQMILSGTPKRIWDGSIELTVTVTDTGAGTSADLTINLTTKKKTLTISDVTISERIYDGTNTVTQECKDGMAITLSGIYGSDDVYVDLDNISVYYDSKNAGIRDLEFSNIELLGAQSANYTIASSCTVEDAAKITKKKLSITLIGEIYKYAGEKAADPSSQNFEINFADTVDQDTRDLVNGDGGLTSKSVLEITYDVPEVNEEKTYDIPVTVLSDNYDVECDASCTLVVTQDKAVLKTDEAADGTYNFSVRGTFNEDTGWYTDVVEIWPELQHGADYYNQILRVGEQEWSSGPISIDDDSDLNGQPVQVMMKNSRTGAYTTASDEMVFNVDSQAPVYEGAAFTAASKTSILENIGYFFSYGNFFKESVTATLSFSDNKSGCSEIYYDIKGLGVENKDSWAREKIEDDTFIVTIPMGTNNVISFYTVDNAGNESDVTTLKGNADGSEWVIENSVPVITGYHVANMDGDRISNLSSGGWYNQEVQLIAEVKESESGVHYADWYINGEVDRITEDSLVRSDEYTTVPLAYPFTSSGIYEVALDVSDNAMNTSGKSDLTTIRIDLEAPDIHLDEEAISDNWSQSVEIPFTVTDDISGVYKVSVVPPVGSSYELKPDADGIYTLTASMEGEYTIYARDEANNENAKTITLNNISKEVPKNATVTWSPEKPNGSNNWYTIKTAAKITPVVSTGKVPTVTYYKLWSGSAEPTEAVAISETTTVAIPSDGVWNLKVWTETAAGVKSAGEYLQTVYVDTTAPEAMVTNVLAETAYQTVTFTVTDATSGITAGQIKVVNGTTTVASQVTAFSDGSGYQGTFTVSSPGDYVVQVSDLAGNVSTSATYTPMTLKVNAIKNITENTATISSISYRGTYSISSVKYEYKKAASSSYTEITPYAVKDAQGNVTASYSFRNLEANTKYNYRITAVSAIGEALNYTGSFKTAGVDGIGITGKVVDADNASATITVSLFEGNTVLKTTEVRSGNSFVFTKVADGNYNITASNGITTKTISVNVYNGRVIDPAGDILITLRNGMSTSVVISGSKTPNVSVSGLDDIFTYDTVNFTEADKKFIAEGGTVEFRLTVAYKSSGAVTQSALSAIYKLMSDNEKVNMFLDLTLTKIRTYASGAVESTKQVTELAGGVKLKIVVPMSEKIINAKEKSIIRVHGNSASLLADLDASANSYTIETNKFSIYALTYKAAANEETTTEDQDNDDKKDEDNGSDDNEKSIKDYDSSPKTGDNSPVAVLGGFMMISLAGLVFLRKRYK